MRKAISDKGRMAGCRIGRDHKFGLGGRFLAGAVRVVADDRAGVAARPRIEAIVDPLETRGRRFGEAPEAIENLDNRRFTAKENTGILGLKRFQATIRRAVWPIGWRPGKETGVEASLGEPAFETGEAVRGKGNVRLLPFVRHASAK